MKNEAYAITIHALVIASLVMVIELFCDIAKAETDQSIYEERYKHLMEVPPSFPASTPTPTPTPEPIEFSDPSHLKPGASANYLCLIHKARRHPHKLSATCKRQKGVKND